jgi:hypothetical protein
MPFPLACLAAALLALPGAAGAEPPDAAPAPATALAPMPAAPPAPPAPAAPPEAPPDRTGLAAPLGLRTEGTFRLLFLDMPLQDARAPRAAFDLRWSLANDWSTPTYARSAAGTLVELRTDEQADALTASIRLPWSRLLGDGPRLGDGLPLYRRLSTTFDGRLTEHWGGWSDGVISWYHGFAGFTNFDRDRYPEDQLHVALGSPGGAYAVNLSGATFSWGDVTARTQLLLAEGGEPVVAGQGPDAKRWGLSARLDLKVPTGSLSRAGGSGGWDLGVGIAGTAELTSWLVAHAMVTTQLWSHLGADVALQPQGLHWSADLSLVAVLGQVAIFFEDRVVSAMFDDTGWTRVIDPTAGDDASSAWAASFRAHNQLSGGVRWGRFTAWFSEDFTPGSNPAGVYGWFYDSNAPDLVIGLSFTQPL